MRVALIGRTFTTLHFLPLRCIQRRQPRIDRVHLTRLHMTVDGDAFFPSLPESQWREVSRSPRRLADERNACDMTFLTLERR